jgi:Tol biopolymer transport system component
MNRARFLYTTTSLFAASLFDAGSKGRLRQLTSPGGNDNRATFMPNDRTILFASQRTGKSQIWAIERGGGRPTRLHESAANDYGRVAPNTDGTQLAFSSDRNGTNAIFILSLTNGNVRAISDPEFWSFGPTWSEQSGIAYFTKKGGNQLNIWTVRADGSGAKQLTNSPGESRQPWWSADGSTLAFSANHAMDRYSIYLSDAESCGFRKLTDDGSYAQPFWAPDGKSIAVSAKIGESHARICVMNADGSNLRSIVQPEGIDNQHPAWSRDGQSIVFTSGKGSEASLFICDVR